MGTNVLLDILTSVVIGGILLMNIMNMNANASTQSDIYSVTRIAQKNLVAAVQIIEHDFRKMGYGVVDPTKSIIYADTSKIIFLADLNRNGIKDTISYYLGLASELSNTPNPRDRLLYRVVNSELPQASNLGIVRFRLDYFNQDLKVVTHLPSIKIVEIKVEVESPFPLHNPSTGEYEYPAAFWKQTRLTSRNLNR
jgi:type II secretory pathway component PulJ